LCNINPKIEFVLSASSTEKDVSSTFFEQAALRQVSSSLPLESNKPMNGSVAVISSQDPRSTMFGINREFTFDSFVVGSNNEIAHSATKTVAKSPGRTPFNPLLIYGGVGLGKTHLLQAVANLNFDSGGAKNAIYITSEQFVREFVTSLKENRTLQFAKQYRQADILLVDDIQFFQGKERMQEEFFHTFNTLHSQGKQIILSSDRPPEALGGLQDRLLSRFQWGLVADIQAPDVETKIAICEKKAEATGLHLESRVTEFIATQVRSNVRELEGIIKRLLFLVQNHNAKLTLDMVENAVRTMRLSTPEPVTIKRIQEAVAFHYGVPVEMLIGRGRRADIVIKRHLAMYLCKILTVDSLRTIGTAFGGRDHTTVLHACERFQRALIEERALVIEMNAVSASLGISGPGETHAA
jgi:chromosomal replication initiator protein